MYISEIKFRIKKKIDYLFSVLFSPASLGKEISHTNKTPSKRFMNKIPAPPSQIKTHRTDSFMFYSATLRPVNPEKHPFIREISSPNYTIPLAFKISQTCDTSLYHCHGVFSLRVMLKIRQFRNLWINKQVFFCQAVECLKL